jgi:hypothetical protein
MTKTSVSFVLRVDVLAGAEWHSRSLLMLECSILFVHCLCGGISCRNCSVPVDGVEKFGIEKLVAVVEKLSSSRGNSDGSVIYARIGTTVRNLRRSVVSNAECTEEELLPCMLMLLSDRDGRFFVFLLPVADVCVTASFHDGEEDDFFPDDWVNLLRLEDSLPLFLVVT